MAPSTKEEDQDKNKQQGQGQQNRGQQTQERGQRGGEHTESDERYGLCSFSFMVPENWKSKSPQQIQEEIVSLIAYNGHMQVSELTLAITEEPVILQSGSERGQRQGQRRTGT